MLESTSLTFHQEVKKVPYSEANKMLFFTGGGFSAEGKLKPDVTFLGNGLFSDSRWFMIWMVVRVWRHLMAGATALIKQTLEQRFLNYSPE